MLFIPFAVQYLQIVHFIIEQKQLKNKEYDSITQRV